MKLRKSAQRASNFPLMQRIIRPFRPPLSHQGKYIIRFEGLRGLFTYQAPRRMMTMMSGTTLQGSDILNSYRRFKFKWFTLTKTVAELNFWTTAWTAFCSSSCLPFAKLWQTCWRKECKWWHRMSVITYEWNNALEFHIVGLTRICRFSPQIQQFSSRFRRELLNSLRESSNSRRDENCFSPLTTRIAQFSVTLERMRELLFSDEQRRQ